MSNERVVYKRDSNGRLVRVPVTQDRAGNWQAPSGAGTSRANQYVTSCNQCGNNNYTLGSYCSRCR